MITFPTARTRLLTSHIPWVCKNITLDTVKGLEPYHGDYESWSEHGREFPLVWVPSLTGTITTGVSNGSRPVETLTLRLAFLDKVDLEHSDQQNRLEQIAAMDEASVQFMYLLTKRFRDQDPTFMITSGRKDEQFLFGDAADATCGVALELTITLPNIYDNCARLNQS